MTELFLPIIILFAVPSNYAARSCGQNAITDKTNNPARIAPIRDENAKGTWPWMVSIGKFDLTTLKYVHLCGGSLITSNKVLTAAHCVNDEG